MIGRESAVLLACARRFIGAAAPGEVREALAEDLDWPRLLQMAGQHAMLPLLYWELQSDSRRPPHELRMCFEANARSNMAKAAELITVLDLLDRNEIEALPMKGPALAVSAYGNLALRSFADLDLLIRREDVIRAKDVLIRDGYRMASHLHWASPSACLRSKDSELLLERGHGGPGLDLHWKLLPGYFAPLFGTDQLWRDLRTVSLGGRSVRTLSDENLLLFLCAHGSKHRWERLGWLCDVALIVNGGEIDWELVMARARQQRVERMVLLGLHLVSHWLGAEVPEAVRERVAAQPRVAELTAEIRNEFIRNPLSTRPAIESCRLNLRMLERFRDKVRFVIGTLVTPTEAEWHELRLPPALYFLYYPYRLARLTAKYARPR